MAGPLLSDPALILRSTRGHLPDPVVHEPVPTRPDAADDVFLFRQGDERQSRDLDFPLSVRTGGLRGPQAVRRVLSSCWVPADRRRTGETPARMPSMVSATSRACVTACVPVITQRV